jgi:hypothetical protein
MAGKRLDANSMLDLGRRRSARGQATGEPDAAQRDDVATSQPSDVQASPRSDVTTSQRLDVPTSRRRDDHYRRVTVYLTPAQHQWAKQAARDAAAEGLSASDVVRLALARLERAAALGDVDLARELVDQAHDEAERFPGRLKRGLPDRP